MPLAAALRAPPLAAGQLRGAAPAKPRRRGGAAAAAVVASSVAAPDKALIEAACDGDADAAVQALKDGANVDTRGVNQWGQPPLSLASMRGHADVVRACLRAGADVNAHDSLGHTPLVFAVQNGRKEVTKLLLAAGADAWAADKYGMTAQDWAARVKWPASEEIEEMLRQHAARAAQAGQDKAAAAGTAPRDAA